MSNSQFFTSAAGIKVEINERSIPLESALSSLKPALDTRKGILFSSGFDYPGRHSRWDIAFVDPALELIAQARQFQIRALNPQGKHLFGILLKELGEHPHIADIKQLDDELQGQLVDPASRFTEEERSKQASIFSVIRALLTTFGCPKDEQTAPLASHFGLYGAFGYDLVLQFEDITRKQDRSDVEDCHLFLPLELTIVDRKREQASRIEYSIHTEEGPSDALEGGGATFRESTAPDSVPAEIQSDHGDGEFAHKVEKVIEGTKRGDYFEVVLSQEFSTGYKGKASALFETLARLNPSPYMFLMNFGTEQLIGASPEIYVRVTGDIYETCPIAGTARRGENAIEDAERVKELIASLKDESELTMCTDVDRNDMARVCKPGTVKILGRRQLEFYSHLIHTVDHLQGELAEEFDSIDAFQTHMWACTVTGAPKPAALQEIENLENSPRGWYSGAIGMISFQGDINTGIMLRTAHVKNGIASIRAGATLLYDSDPILEERETRTKAAAFLAALAQTKSPQKTREQATIPAKRKRSVLLIDCRDSFIHMLASYLRELGAEVSTVRSTIAGEVLQDFKGDLVLLSPGPGTPNEFGVPQLVADVSSRGIAVFGVCLGHQGIGQHFGAELAQLPIPMHGKASLVRHTDSKLFAGVPAEFSVGRYHSLYLRQDTLPDTLRVTAHCTFTHGDGQEEPIPMAVEHTELPIAGVQFHPESLMSLAAGSGHTILRNVLDTLG